MTNKTYKFEIPMKDRAYLRLFLGYARNSISRKILFNEKSLKVDQDDIDILNRELELCQTWYNKMCAICPPVRFPVDAKKDVDK